MRPLFCLFSLLFVLAPLSTRAKTPPLRSIGVLVVPGVYNSELMAPYDVLHHLRFHVKDPPQIFTVAPQPGPLTTFEGLVLTPQYSFANAPPIDLLIVPSAEHNLDSDLENQALIQWVRKTGQNARYLMSLCDGAFVLGRAGLLDGLWATTFPGDQAAFQKRYPQVKLLSQPLFVHDGKAITSQGGARSYEPALYLTERLYGREVAEKIGRGLVIAWKLAAIPHRIAPTAR